MKTNKIYTSQIMIHNTMMKWVQLEIFNRDFFIFISFTVRDRVCDYLKDNNKFYKLLVCAEDPEIFNSINITYVCK